MKYQRITSVGYNTGKVVIGCAYMPRAKDMTENECFVQNLVRGKGLPPEQAAKDIWLKVKSIFYKGKQK